MLISKECLEFVKGFEGFYPKPYLDIVGVKTLGYGMTGKEIEGLSSVTEPQASKMLEDLLNNKYALPIKNNLASKSIELNQNQFDALVSMAYNIGVNGLLGSTLYKNICNGNRDRNTITSNFRMWSMAGGKIVNGLLRRRTEEAQMFFKEGSSMKPVKTNYILEFQKWYNKTTQTSKPLTEDGDYGTKTQKAYETLGKLLGGSY